MEDKLKILLCEDDENLGMLLREYLQAKGYVTELCPDGEAGYKAFLKTKFDICVLDVMMPKKDGYTLAQEIRQANAVIAVAGMEGALPSVIAGMVSVPVIAVPTSVGYGASFQGVAPLLTMLNSCAEGVAVVNIDNGYGAGYLANQINQLAIRN